MTNDTKLARRLAPLPAATLAALLLAGCSSGNIGESWQCPLAKGGSCDSVAAADPAVPDAGGRTVLGEPLWQVRERAPEPRSETACTAGCDGGFDPFAWLARLFQADPGSESGANDRDGSRSPHAEGPKTGTVGAAAQSPPAPAAAALPAEPAGAEDGPQADDLRTGEVVARIWIASFVDADGIYREASHVRVVLEPAGWRLK